MPPWAQISYPLENTDSLSCPQSYPCKVLTDVRKIASTSDINKLYEGILRDWILDKIDTKQFGGQKGTRTKHLLVCLVDRVLQLLDRNTYNSTVIMNGVDWEKAFDRNDPMKTAKKLQFWTSPLPCANNNRLYVFTKKLKWNLMESWASYGSTSRPIH